MKNIIFNKYGSAAKNLFNDLIDLPETLDIDVNIPRKNRVVEFIRLAHTSQRVRRHVHLPGQELWFSMDRINQFADERANFIFINETLAFINEDVLNKIRRHYPQGRFVLVVLDAMHANARNLVVGRPVILNWPWDLVLSFNQDDCDEYGFKNLELNYFSIPRVLRDMPPRLPERELVYLGGAQKNDTRVGKVRDIYACLSGQGVDCDFVITNWPEQNDGIQYEKDYVSYGELIRREYAGKCILEVLKENQNYNSARYFEAVVMNRKLLSNNPNLTSLPYYDEKYMRYFSRPEEIDAAWLKDGAMPDYHYRGEFSPVHIPELIERYLGK
ncbi:MAG: hypothetical protein IJH44_03500 [Solobacterium sp.]|nr:hypothetical protein [Solobacterium sp.]